MTNSQELQIEIVDFMLKKDGLPTYTEIITLLNYWNRHKPDTLLFEIDVLCKRIGA